MMCAGMQVATIFQEHDRIIGLAKLAGTFDNGLEYRFDIGRRGGDHGLIGEGLEQGDLLITVGMHLRATQQDNSNALILAQQWDAQNGSNMVPARDFLALGELFSFRGEIMHMHRLAIDNCTTGGPLTIYRPSLPDDGNRSMLLLEQKIIAILQGHNGIVRLAKLAGAHDNSLEDRPDIGR